jgi:hypothetical protein
VNRIGVMRPVEPAIPGFRPSDQRELEHLRLCWGLLYQIEHDQRSGQWSATPTFAPAATMTAASASDLRELIRADWLARRLGGAGRAADG